MVMDKVQLIEFLGEMLYEFRAVIREHIDEWVGNHHEAVLKEFLCGQRSMRGDAPSKTESGVYIFKGDDVSPAAVHKSFYGIQRNQMSLIRRSEIFWLTQDLFALQWHCLAVMAHLLGEYP